MLDTLEKLLLAQNEIASLRTRLERAEADTRRQRDRLKWIACSTRDELEEMYAQTACDDVDDLCRFIDAALAAKREGDSR